MLTLHLNDRWTCEFTVPQPELNTITGVRADVPALDQWRIEESLSQGWEARIERSFQLFPLDECVRYLLHIDSAPPATQLSINRQNLGVITAPCQVDVTAYVSLDDNRIAFHISGGARGDLGGVRLQAVLCEQFDDKTAG
jgi:hypothetical protein